MIGKDSLVVFSSLLVSVIPMGNSTVFQIILDFPKTTCKNKDWAFKVLDIQTSMACGSICASDVDCKSFFYSPTLLKCDGCKHKYRNDEQLEATGEQTFYYAMIYETFKIQYQYIGCFTPPCDAGYGQCVLMHREFLDDVSASSCFQFCDNYLNATILTVALQPGLCICGMEYNTNLPGYCDTSCAGNPDDLCGSSSGAVVSVYSKKG